MVADPSSATPPGPKPSATASKPAGKTGPAAIPADVASAVHAGGADILVTYDSSVGLSKMRAATKRLDRSSRQAGADQAAAVYAKTKSAALRRAGRGLRVRKDYDRLPFQLVNVADPAALTTLAATPGVVGLATAKKSRPTAVPDDLALIHQPQAAASGFTGTGVSVAVLDTGVDPALAGGAFGDCSGGYGTAGCRIDNYVDSGGSGQADVDGTHHHGTNVAATVAATAPGAHLSVYNVFHVDGTNVTANDGDILAALNAVTRDGPARNIRSVNMSLGSGGFNTTECTDSIYSTAFLNLRALGIVPVVSAGNGAMDSGTYQSGVASPACATGAVRVGAVYANSTGGHGWGCTENPGADHIACFSQGGPLLSLLAPGVDIVGGGVTLSGTSQAAPHVSGAVADLVSANATATAQQLVRALITTGPLVADGRDDTQVHRLDIPAAAAAVTAAGAEQGDATCRANNLPANDDGSTGSVGLPFPVNFFGTTYSSLYVNNNGNVTFDGPLSTYTPFTIAASTPPIIAPFLADIDTRGGGSAPVTFGTTTYGSRSAFCIDWDNVGYYSAHDNKLNSFQLLLVDRGDLGAGDFDIVFNYGALTWETGDASGGSNGLGGTAAGAGFSAGDGNPDHFFQFPGSLTRLGLLDSNPSTGLVNQSRGTLQPGRYIFPVRNGAPPGAGTIAGVVRGPGGTPQVSAPVQACPATGSCLVGLTGPDGRYVIVGVTPGRWSLVASPPRGSSLLPGRAGPITVGTGATVQQDLTLSGPQPLPDGTTITDLGTTGDGIPIILWTQQLTLQTNGCAGGTAAYTMTLGGRTVRSGGMTETPDGSGHYRATIEPLYPDHGAGAVAITVHCPDGSTPEIDFNIYIDPSGTVVDQHGAPVSGATVTLLRADTAVGPFVPVPDGSELLSPSARHNPETTGADGVFHWDVLAGFYQVKAEKDGCTPATSAVYEVPPPAVGIALTLTCATPVEPTTTTVDPGPAPIVVGQPATLTATVAGNSPTGTVAFTADGGLITTCPAQPITAGQATCTVTFAHATTAPVTVTAAYGGDATHAASSGTTSVTVTKATPDLIWDAPAAIGYPTALGSGQLNATADVPGTFTYTLAGGAAATGAILGAGSHQVRVRFDPADSADYSSATAQVTVTVLPGTQTIAFAPIPAERSARSSFSVTDLATASSGLPVTFTGSGACTVATGGAVAVTGTGNCTIVAAQPGDANYAAAEPVSQTVPVGAPPPSPLSLSASATTAHAYQPVKLTATLARDGQHTRQSVVIVEPAAGNKVVGRCAAVPTCTAQVTSALGHHTYVARLLEADGTVAATSTPVEVVWEAPTVTLTASRTDPPAGGSVTLTATSSFDLRSTPWSIWIVDTTTHHTVASCRAGIRCSVRVRDLGRHTYEAVIGPRADSGVQSGAPSRVTVTWASVTVTLTASNGHPAADRGVVLRARADADLTHTPYQLVIVDVTDATHPTVVARCTFGDTCWARVVRHGGARTYVAKVVQRDEQLAASDRVTITWAVPPPRTRG